VVFDTVVGAVPAVLTASTNPSVLFATVFDSASTEVNALLNVDAMVIAGASVVSDRGVAASDRSVRSVRLAHDFSVPLSNLTQYLAVRVSIDAPMHAALYQWVRVHDKRPVRSRDSLSRCDSFSRPPVVH